MAQPLTPDLPESLGILSAELQNVFEEELQAYTRSVRARGIPGGFKLFNDPIWFTIRIESWELVVVDSPVVQRLRDIKQLGLAGLVYPAAGYSRFEHTIGALYQTQRVIESIIRNAKAQSALVHRTIESTISPSDEIQLRLAAILHDVGHCFLSHVSERSLNRLQITEKISMEAARADARSHFGCVRKPAVGEILSALLILLPEFQEVLEAAKIPYWQGKESELADRIARLVIKGRLYDRPFMNELISGTIDSDKLDYMARDCYMAGLAMPIDTERLIENLCVVNVPADKLPEYRDSTNLSDKQTVQVFAIQHGGAKVFEDLVLSRVLLYDKLYNHQKVRAMEGAVVNALEILQAHHPAFQMLSTYVRLSDSEFLACRWPDVAEAKADIDKAAKVIERIKQRNFVRAFAFGSELISFPAGDSEEAQRSIRHSWRQLAKVTGRDWSQSSSEFRKAVRERAQRYLRTMGQPSIADDLDDASIVIDLPDVQGIAKRTKCFVGDESTGIRLFNELFRVEKWAEAYENQKLTGFAFCPAEAAVAVHLAFRDEVRERFGLGFEPWSWSLTKVRIAQLESWTSKLVERNVETPRAYRPNWLLDRQQYLASEETRTKVLQRYSLALEELGDRFSTYQSDLNEKVSKHRIEDWLAQFAPAEVPLAINILQKIKYWDRASITDAFASHLEGLGSPLKNSQWVPLGGSTTSSHHLNYLWPDLRKDGLSPAIVLASADEIAEGTEVVFYDDNVGSAGQSKTVLQQWFGVDPKLWFVNEEHVKKLDDKILKVLKNANITFLFATGRREGLSNLLSYAKELFSNDHIQGEIVIPTDLSCFRPSSGVFDSRSSAESAKLAFRAAGSKALSDKINKWDEPKINNRLLGYGNHGGLTVFYYNVPTTTLTALWKSSDAPGSPWMGLFPRRPRE